MKLSTSISPFPVAKTARHVAREHWFNSQRTHELINCVLWMQFKSIWIKESAKCTDVGPVQTESDPDRKKLWCEHWKKEKEQNAGCRLMHMFMTRLTENFKEHQSFKQNPLVSTNRRFSFPHMACRLLKPKDPEETSLLEDSWNSLSGRRVETVSNFQQRGGNTGVLHGQLSLKRSSWSALLHSSDIMKIDPL